MDKRTLMAIALAILVMTSYSFIMQKHFPAPKKAAQPVTNEVTVQRDPSSVVPQAVVTETVRFSSPELVKLSTDNIEYVLSDIGGCVKSANIKKYNNLEKNEPVYVSEFPRDAIFSLSGLTAAEDIANAKYRYAKTAGGAEFTLNAKNGIEIKKIYKLNNANGLDLEIKIKNTSLAPISAAYTIVGPSNLITTVKDDKRFIEPSAFLNGKRVKMKVPRNVVSTWNVYPGPAEWVALQGKYFTIVTKPYQGTVSSTVSLRQNNDIVIELQNDTVKIEPGETVSYKYLLYVGPVEYNTMASYNAGIEKSVHLGTFEAISKALLWLLNTFNKVFHNYGVSIILLAVLISFIVYPLTLKSFKSMKEMQILQPKIEKLRREHKENPQKLNKEIMELYKKHKVNPFGGCLPMLLQMPIFIALYQAFSRALELKGARFLWIKDLSLADRAFFISTGPDAGIPINILPILMAITMFFQQRLSTQRSHVAVGDKEDVMQQQQKMMAVMMPILFGFIFYNMPSGLVLYWFINTLVMFFQQARIMKTFHVESIAA